MSAPAIDAGTATGATSQSMVRGGTNLWLIAFVVTMATFMEVLDTSIVNVALPHMAGSLSAGQDESTWVLTSYLVSNAIVLPISGWLATAFGRKRFYMMCVALFTASSFLCGLAPTLGSLVFFRCVQGLGGGGLQPSEQAILVDTFPQSKRGMAFAIAGIATVLAPIIGPTLGGWITDNYSWRWCFYINVPVGAVSLLLTWNLLQDPRGGRPGIAKRIDWIGIALVAIGLGCLQVVLDKGEREDWFESAFIVGFALSAAIGIVSMIWWVLKHHDPIVDLRLLKHRTFGASCVTMFMLGFFLYGSTVAIPLLLQTLMGYTATQAGLVLSPGGGVVLVLMPLAGFCVNRVQPRTLVRIGLAVHGLAVFLLMTRFDLQMDYATVATARCAQAAGIAFLFVPINTAAYADLPPEKNNNASALLTLMRNLGASVGIATVTTMIARRAQMHQARLVEHMTPLDPAFRAAGRAIQGALTHAGGLSAAQASPRVDAILAARMGKEAGMLAYLDVFYVLGVACIATLLLTFAMKDIDLRRAKAGH